MGKRRSPDEDDIDRVSDELFRRSGNSVQDRDSFDLAFNDYFNSIESDLSTERKSFRDKTFKEYGTKHPEISKDRLFSKAGGKDLRRDREITAKEKVRTPEEFVRRGAKRVDLEGFDTKVQRQTKRIKEQKQFNLSGRIKTKIVFVRQDVVINQGRRVIVHRAKDGRFASRRLK